MESRIGPWVLLEELGRGGMASVWRVRHAAGGPELALKLLHAGAAASEAQRRRFEREVQALAALDHPHVVRVRDAGEHRGELRAEGVAASAAKPRGRGAPYLVMDLVEGTTLQARLTRQGPLPVDEAVLLVTTLARAVAHAHARGVLHRDLKPENVLVRARDGAPLLTDFGLARVFDGGPADAPLTMTGQLLGTPGYWAPELALGRRAEVGERTDVFGLGATLYALLTARPPGGSTFTEAADLERVRPAPSVLRPQVDRALDAIVLRCLAPQPAMRWPSAGALAGALEAWTQGAQETRAAGGGARPFLLVSAVVAAALPVAGWLLSADPTPTAAAPAAAPPAPSAAPEPGGPPARDADAWLAEARACDARGNAAGALEALGRAIASAPSRPELHLLRADLRLRRGDATGALEDCTLELALGEQVAALLLRGVARHQLQDFPGAIRDCDRALELHPADPVALGNRGSARISLGDVAGAIQDCERAVELDPRQVTAWLVLGQARMQSGDPAGARSAAETVLTLDPALVDAVDLLAHALDAQGDRRGAIATWTRAIELAPQAARLFSARGVARGELGDAGAAEADFSRAIELDPRATIPWANRGRLRLFRNDLQGAIADTSAALRLDATNVVALDVRAAARFASGDAEGALEDYGRELEVAPRSPHAYTARAVVRRKLGDLTGAIEDDTRALALDPRSITSWINRSDDRLRLGDLEGALADAQRAIELNPNEPVAWLNRGDARLASGDLPGGVADLRRALELQTAARSPQVEATRKRVEAAEARLRAGR